MARPHIIKEKDFEDFLPTTLMASSSSTSTRELKRMVVESDIFGGTVLFIVTHGDDIKYDGVRLEDAIEAYNDIT